MASAAGGKVTNLVTKVSPISSFALSKMAFRASSDCVRGSARRVVTTVRNPDSGDP
jgi:hypothetical protein